MNYYRFVKDKQDFFIAMSIGVLLLQVSRFLRLNVECYALLNPFILNIQLPLR